MSSGSDHENVSENEGVESNEVAVVSEGVSKKSDILELLDVDDLENLPEPVKKRVNALKNLQLEVTNLEAKFYEEVHLLECKYNRLYYPIHEKRQHIITGIYEPKAEETEWKLEAEVADEISKELKEKVKVEDSVEKSADDAAENTTAIVGIPLFWITALKHVTMIAEMIQDCDNPILAHLIDIKTIILEADPMGFVLEFHFSANEFFSNSVLTKEYEMKCMPDPCDPFTFEGPEIVKCKGCKIDWKKGKNVTVRQVKKKQKHKNRSAVTRTVIKTIENESFFRFFSPPDIPEDSDSESYDETQALLTNDFEIGHFIRERVVPNAVLYFTGEAMDEDYDDDEEEEEDEFDDEEDSDMDDGKEGSPKKKGQDAKSAQIGGKNPGNPADCKQQ